MVIDVDALTIVGLELLGGGIISALLCFTGWYLKRLVAGMDKWKEDREKHERSLSERMQNLELAIMQMQDSLSERLAREQELIAQIESLAKDVALLKDGETATLRDRILQSRRYFCEKGYIPASEFENIEQMYKSYAALGGNGLAHRAFMEISNLPFEPPTDD